MNTYHLRSRTIPPTTPPPLSSPTPTPPPSYVLIFDTETTGLLSKEDINTKKLHEYPHIIQLAYELYDEETETVVESYNNYIQIPQTVEITSYIQQLTGITPNLLCTNGIHISDALVSFYHAYSKSKRIVAHNIAFDIKMIQIEIMRNYSSMKTKGCMYPENIFNPIYELSHNKEIYCTMKHGLRISNLWQRSYKSLDVPLSEHEYIKEVTLENGQMIKTRLEKKFPKLENLYIQIYGVLPENLHNAKVDVEICRRVYEFLIYEFKHNLSKVKSVS